MQKINRKDKILLMILAIILVLFLPYYFFTSGVIDNIDAKNQTISVLQVQENEIKAKRLLLEAVRREAKATANEVLKNSPNTNPMVKSYEVHYLFTKLIKENNLEHQTLTVSELTPVEEITVSENAADKFDNTKIGLSTKKKTELNTKENMQAQKLNVSFSVRGSFESILKLCDDINQYSEYITIDSISVPKINKADNTQGIIDAQNKIDAQDKTNANIVVCIFLTATPKAIPTE